MRPPRKNEPVADGPSEFARAPSPPYSYESRSHGPLPVGFASVNGWITAEAAVA